MAFDVFHVFELMVKQQPLVSCDPSLMRSACGAALGPQKRELVPKSDNLSESEESALRLERTLTVKKMKFRSRSKKEETNILLRDNI
ncbi:hypothetical protein RUM43_011492 [Polyplax serrata]|uniref:Uncharacterized protein n=1 Tax=Polyplax serrata TaxID=468196 RepID=A0AAN8P7T7_POLSC